MRITRAAHLGVAVLATFAVRLLARTKPQRWCPPSISLRLFRLSSRATNAINTADLRRHVPSAGWSVRSDLHYGSGRFERFDLALPDHPGPHPLVVWVHGGGWHFGDKADLLPYAEKLAAAGFAVATVNYPLAPRAHYPAAPDAVRGALEHLRTHAADLDVDPDRVVLAGDSAGAQIVAELAVTGTTPLRGMALFCGIFDPSALDDSDRMFEAVLGSAMWSVTRSRRWQSSPECARMNVLDRLTPAFPPTFLSGGLQDPLYRRQTPPMTERLRELGVPLEEFYPGEDSEPCYHEYQMWLGTPAGAEAFARLVGFLQRVTTNSH